MEQQQDQEQVEVVTPSATATPQSQSHHPLLEESGSSHPLLGVNSVTNLKASFRSSSPSPSSSTSNSTPSTNPISNSTRFSSLRQPAPTATRPNYFDLKGLTQKLERAEVEAHEQLREKQEARERDLQIDEKRKRRWTQFQGQGSGLFDSEINFQDPADGDVFGKGKGKEREVESEDESERSDTFPQGVLTPRSSRSPAPLSPRIRSLNSNHLFGQQVSNPARSFRDTPSANETPRRRNGSSRDATLSPAPPSISRGGTPSPFEENSSLFGGSSTSSRQDQPIWESEEDESMDDEGGQLSQGLKPSLNLLSSLHLMSDLEIRALSKSVLEPRKSEQPQTDPSFDLSSLFSLLRSTSIALSTSLSDSSSLQDDLASSEAESSSALRTLQNKSAAREEVLKGLCKERGGITDGEIKRALTRASAPVIEATPLKARSRTPLSNGGATPSRTKGKEREDEDSNLFSSLQEAMLDDVSGNDQVDRLGTSPPPFSSSRNRSRSVTPSNSVSGRKGTSSPGSRSISTTRSRDSSSHQSAAKSSDPPSSDRSGRGPDPEQTSSLKKQNSSSSKSLPTEAFSSSNDSRHRSKSVSSTSTDKSAGGLGGWASGLLPWGASNSNVATDSLKVGSSKATSTPGRAGKARAITQSTSPAEVEADGYMSPDPNGPTDTASPSRSRSTSSSISIEATDAKVSSTSKTSSTPSNSGAKPSTGGLSLLGSLAWRRKKVNPSIPKGIRETQDPPDMKPTPPLLSPTAVEREPSLSSYFSTENSTSSSITHDVGDASSKLSRHTDSTSASATLDPNSPRPTSGSTSPRVNINESTASLKFQSDTEVERNRDEVPSSRPTASHTISGREISTALYEAIGTPPPLSPVTERLQAQLGVSSAGPSGASTSTGSLPKPPHFKAIFLATRIMTSDPTSIVSDSGKRTGDLVATLALSLVGRAREEGKVIDEIPSKRVKESKDAASSLRKVSSGVSTPTSTLETHVEDQPDSTSTANAPVPERTSRKSSLTTAATAATLGRAFGRYKDSSASTGTIQPNVTRLPHLYSYSSPSVKSVAGSSKLDRSIGKGEESSVPVQTPKAAPISVELESMGPLDTKPPTFALFSRQNNKRNENSGQKETKSGARRLGSLSEGEESSGDEFEVYGGKGLVQPPAYPSAEPVDSKEEDASQHLADRYGFVYNPEDVKLLRQARKESTSAPACLTGIRVGVTARGVDEDDEDGIGIPKENISLDENGSASESDEPGSSPSSASAARRSASIKTADSSIGIGNRAQSDAASMTSQTSQKSSATGGLLPVGSSKPLAEPSTLSAAFCSSFSSGPTSPSQELDFALPSAGSETGGSIQMDDSSAKSENSPSFSDPKRIQRTRSKPKSSTSAPDASNTTATPSISSATTSAADGENKKALSAASQTVKSLLGQLQAMHDKQQADQQALWDVFLQRRKEKEAAIASKESKEAPKGSKASTLNSDSPNQAHDPEEGWSSGLVGIARMGDHSTKSSRSDWKEFLNLCQSGVPLIYRSRIWQECSGANEAMEPGKYLDLLKEHEGESNSCTNQIDLDVHRTMPTNIYFGGDGPGVAKLRRLLVAFSWYNPECGYCQGE